MPVILRELKNQIRDRAIPLDLGPVLGECFIPIGFGTAKHLDKFFEAVKAEVSEGEPGVSVLEGQVLECLARFILDACVDTDGGPAFEGTPAEMIRWMDLGVVGGVMETITQNAECITGGVLSLGKPLAGTRSSPRRSGSRTKEGGRSAKSKG